MSEELEDVLIRIAAHLIVLASYSLAAFCIGAAFGWGWRLSGAA